MGPGRGQPGGDKALAGTGEVIVLRYGDGHRMGGIEPAELTPIAKLIDPPPGAGTRSPRQ